MTIQQRYHMTTKDGSSFVEMPNSKVGYRFMQELRKSRREVFGGQRIKEVLQLSPSQVPIGEIVKYT